MPFHFVGGTQHDRDRLRKLTKDVLTDAGIDTTYSFLGTEARNFRSSGKRTAAQLSGATLTDKTAGRSTKQRKLAQHKIPKNFADAMLRHDERQKHINESQPFAIVTRKDCYKLYVNAYGFNQTLLREIAQIIQSVPKLRQAYTIDLAKTRKDVEQALAVSQEKQKLKQKMIDLDLPRITVSVDILTRHDLWTLLSRLGETARQQNIAAMEALNVLYAGVPTKTGGAADSAAGCVDITQMKANRKSVPICVAQWIDALYEFDNFLDERAADPWLTNDRILHTSYCLPQLISVRQRDRSVDLKKLNESRYAANLVPFFLLVKVYHEFIVSQIDYREAAKFLDSFRQRFEPYYASELTMLRRMCLPWHFEEHVERDTVIGRLVSSKVQLEVTDTARAILHYLNTMSNVVLRDAFLKHFTLVTDRSSQSRRSDRLPLHMSLTSDN